MQSNQLPEDTKILFNKIFNVIEIIEAYLLQNKLDDTSFHQISNMLAQLKLKNTEIVSNYLNISHEEINQILKTMIASIEEKLIEFQSKELQELISMLHAVLATQIKHQEFIVPKECLRLQDIQWVQLNKICFRGDDRDPSEIFKEGFTPRGASRLVISEAFQSNDGVIQFSSRFGGAACFPFKPNIEVTWVYIFKTDKVFNVQAHGYMSLLNGGEWGMPMNEEHASQMFVQELITDKIKPENIIAAVQIKRSPRNDYPEEFDPLDFYKNRGCYQIVDYLMNENSIATDEEKVRVKKFIAEEIKANQKSNYLPTPSSGYRRNNEFFRSSSSNDNNNSTAPKCEIDPSKVNKSNK